MVDPSSRVVTALPNEYTLLEPIAQKQKSFIKDTTDFITFIEKTKIGKDTVNEEKKKKPIAAASGALGLLTSEPTVRCKQCKGDTFVLSLATLHYIYTLHFCEKTFRLFILSIFNC